MKSPPISLASRLPALILLAALLSLLVDSGCGVFASKNTTEDKPLETQGPDLLTNRYDNGRTGHLEIAGMNGPAVAAGHWNELATLAVDGAVYAQPLFVKNFMMADKRAHDVVYIATARNRVYAYDANTFALLWHDDDGRLPGPDLLDETLLTPDGTREVCALVSPTWLDGANNELGIGVQSTPVIDRGAGLMYVSYRTRPGSSTQNPAAGAP
ncbi:MAG TPA: hypothetical protein VNO21_12905, partial [Polyangiaceae bacterium]|nr:hypothetical protein [Polyangiaceae bacterium]